MNVNEIQCVKKRAYLFRPKKEEVRRQFRTLHNEFFSDLVSYFSIVTVVETSLTYGPTSNGGKKKRSQKFRLKQLSGVTSE
jgi:hypothetical protein